MIRRSRDAPAVQWTAADWKIAAAMFAPYIFMALLLFAWIMWA